MDDDATFWKKFMEELQEERQQQAETGRELQELTGILERKIERLEEEYEDQAQESESLSMALRMILPRVEQLLKHAERSSMFQSDSILLGESGSSRVLRSRGSPPPLNPLEQLCIAARDGDVERARELLELGKEGRSWERRDTVTDVDAANRIGFAPLHIATRYGKLELVKLLLAIGADSGRRTHFNKTPLHLAAMNGLPQCVRALVDGGADVNSVADGGMTSLHMAAMRGHRETCEALLWGGADPRARDAHGREPANLAATKSLSALIESYAATPHRRG